MIFVEYISVVCGLGSQWRMRVLLVLCPALLAAISIVQGGAFMPFFCHFSRMSYIDMSRCLNDNHICKMTLKPKVSLSLAFVVEPGVECI